MPEGIFNFPRFTEVGPLSGEVKSILNKDSDVDVVNDVFPETSDLLVSDVISEVTGNVYILQVAFESDIGGMSRSGLESFLSDLSIEREIGRMEFATFPSDQVGVRTYTEVKPSFRRKGVATEMWKQTKEVMEDDNVEDVYSLPVTFKGRVLLESQGFTEARGELPGWLKVEI